MPKKKCKDCGDVKDFADFYTCKTMTDGCLNSCKECIILRSTKRRANKLEYIQEYDRNRKNKKERYKKAAEYNRTRPMKRSANSAIGNSIRDGKIIPPVKCECCNEIKKL